MYTIMRTRVQEFEMHLYTKKCTTTTIPKQLVPDRSSRNIFLLYIEDRKPCFGRSAWTKRGMVNQPLERVPCSINRMHLGVACITARADVYAMMMGSLADDQKRQPRLYR